GDPKSSKPDGGKQPGPNKNAPKTVEGDWRFVSFTLNGQPQETLGCPQSITFTAGRYSWPHPQDDMAEPFTGTVKIDPGKNPKTMDLLGDGDNGKGRRCIYELKDDKLMLAMFEPFDFVPNG